jgi:hypothetical protein
MVNSDRKNVPRLWNGGITLISLLIGSLAGAAVMLVFAPRGKMPLLRSAIPGKRMAG